jgi:HK97 family phage major capsid protein
MTAALNGPACAGRKKEAVAAPINELKQKRIDAQNKLTELRASRVAATDEYAALIESGAASPEMLAAAKIKARSFDRAIAAQDELVATTDQKILDIQVRLDADKARAVRGANASADMLDGERPATSGLPALPGRTISALTRLYPRSDFHASEERSENFRGVLAAALGGMPLHPAILAATATEGQPADGGFAVPMDVAAGIFRRAIEESVWLRIGVRLVPMASDETAVNALADEDETNDAEAGLIAGWTNEAEESDAQIMKMRRVVLKSKKLVVLAACSNELADDAPGYVTELEAAISRAIGKRLDRAVLSGTGAATPLGVLNSPATIAVSKEGSQSSGTFTWGNATAMWSRLAPGSHENSWWLVHPTTLPQLLSMSLTIGTGGTQPRGVFEPGGPTGYMLLGRPVVVTSRVKPLGTSGDVILVDPSQIAVGVRRGITVERSTQAFFSSDRLAIRGKFRGDSSPLWSKPRTLVEGNTTVSPVVVLEAR